ncbi:MAG: response regulator, partial [Cytophagaceae bacterium]|nr:response regulator [Gemmatimonadaceae bacterium]
MGERTRAFDWSSTSLGPIDAWPQSLRIAVRIMLDSRYAMWLGWGPDFTFFYNDAYARMTLGPKHPWALGRSTREVWSEIWADVGPRAENVVRTGEATWDEGLLLFLNRRGFLEETYHTFSYSPIPDDGGGIGGMLCVVTEDTERTIGERRLRLLRELAARTTGEARSAEEACADAGRTLARAARDLPFVLIYLLDGNVARLVSATGLPATSVAAPSTIDVSLVAAHGWPLERVCTTGKAEVVTDLAEHFGVLPGGAWPDPAREAVVLPVGKPGQSTLAGFVVAGVSPRLALNDEYLGFLDLLAGHVAATVANARAYEEERQRVQALAELDQAKTAFFSNVSHEFRTPLTLMLGPVGELLARNPEHLAPAVKAELEVVDRNGLRLLRLVNSLLDFSRIEAGRIRAAYQPTDLAFFTAELASVFRSACERAGLSLVVDCPPLGEPVFVDREMWEKVVLNLLSNAFKFTLSGEIAVSLRRAGEHAELRVRDTGSGIPPEEMPRLFERFHRIENAEGRTHEGTGIGLALVQELVHLHGGTVSAESVWREGTTFVVSVPMGSDHVPANSPAPTPARGSAAIGALPYLEEALRWLPDEGDGGGGTNEIPDTAPADDDPDRPHVLVVDDNADMRQYVARLLSEHVRVEVAADGEAALALIRQRTPDLVLTDVMMPRLDGFGLLAAIRADAGTSTIPVIMLSARAGEESRVEGMEAGADDYLVKPFSGRELIARVTAHLQMARMRREATEALQESHARFEALFDAAPMGVYLVDSQLRLRHVNRSARPLFGGVDPLVGRTFAEVMHELWPAPDVDKIIAPFQHVLDTGESYHVPEYAGALRHREPPEFYEWELHRIALPDGTFGVVCYFNDISRHVLARRALADSEQRLREAQSRLESTLEASEVGTWEFDVPTDTVYADANMARIFGISAADAAAGKSLATFVNAVHEEDRERVGAHIREVLGAGERLSVQCRIVTADGVRWTTARGRVERD